MMSTNSTYSVTNDIVSSRSRKAKVIGHLCAFAVAATFLFFAYGKIADVRQFVIAIKNYKMAFMDVRYVNTPAILLPWIEVIAAIGLLIPATRKGAALVIGGLLLFFIYAVFDAAIIRGLDIDCGCGGHGSKAGWITIARNILLLAATIASVYLPTLGRKTNTIDEAPATATGAAVG